MSLLKGSLLPSSTLSICRNGGFTAIWKAKLLMRTAPAVASRWIHNSSEAIRSPRYSHNGTTALHIPAVPRTRGDGERLSRYYRRTFSTHHPLRALVVRNPRNDEDGNEMKIEITPRARLHEIMKIDKKPDLYLRITVESGGCHGFQYLMSLTDKVDLEDDIIFDQDGAKVVMDESSLHLLKGSRIDYTMELIGSQFKIVDNPHATSSCGCGTSFDIKI